VGAFGVPAEGDGSAVETGDVGWWGDREAEGWRGSGGGLELGAEGVDGGVELAVFVEEVLVEGVGDGVHGIKVSDLGGPVNSRH
jgi:hypothetical protein